MKVPFSWLKQYVDIDVTAQELEDKLFGCGFEVEELIDLGGEISKVVVGVVTECVPQEGTHLHICKVDCGEYGHDIQISTGAPNVYAGMHTAAALDGSTLPGGVKIKAKPLMGVESNGMLCSGEELGLNEDLYPGAEVYGLLDLPKDTVPGTPIQQVVGLDDYIFDISITANRADCQSVLGIAREVAAALNKPLKMPATDYTVSDYVDPRLSISVEARISARATLAIMSATSRRASPHAGCAVSWPCAVCAASPTSLTSRTMSCWRLASPCTPSTWTRWKAARSSSAAPKTARRSQRWTKKSSP